MSTPSRELAAALGGSQVDQRAGERPWMSPDHLPAPARWESVAKGRWYLVIGVALVLAAILLPL